VGPPVDFFSHKEPDLSIEFLTNDVPKKKKQKPTPQTFEEFTKKNKELLKRQLNRAQKFLESKDQHGTPPSSEEDDEQVEKSRIKPTYSVKPEDFPKLISKSHQIASESLSIEDEHLVNKKDRKSSKPVHREKVHSEKRRQSKKAIDNQVSASSGKRKPKAKVQNGHAAMKRDKLRSKSKDQIPTLPFKARNSSALQTRKEVNLTKVSKLSYGQQTPHKMPQQTQNPFDTYGNSYQQNFTATTWANQVHYINHMNHPQSYVSNSPNHQKQMYYKATVNREDLEKKMLNWVKTNLQLFWPTPVKENEICTFHQAQLNDNEIQSYLSVSTQSISKSKRQNDTNWKEQSTKQFDVPSEEVVIPVNIGDINSYQQMPYSEYVPFSNSYEVGNISIPSQSIPYINSSTGGHNTVLGHSNYPIINSWINVASPYHLANSHLSQMQSYYPGRNMPMQMSVYQSDQPTTINQQMIPRSSSMIPNQQTRTPTTSRVPINRRSSDRSKDFTSSTSSYQKNSPPSNDEFSTQPRGINTKKNIQNFFKQLNDFEKISFHSKFHTQQRAVVENKRVIGRPSEISYSRLQEHGQRASHINSQTKIVGVKETAKMTKTRENCAYKINAQRPMVPKTSAEQPVQDPRSSSWADMLKGNKAAIDCAIRLDVDSQCSQKGNENVESKTQHMKSPSFPRSSED